MRDHKNNFYTISINEEEVSQVTTMDQNFKKAIAENFQSPVKDTGLQEVHKT